jgi:hypothetical protein
MDAFMPVVLLAGVAFILFIIFAPLLTLRLSKGLRWVRPAQAVMVMLSFATLGLLVFFCDDMWAATQSRIFCTIIAGLGAGISATTFRRQKRVGLSLGALFTAGIFICHFWDLTPVKPFHRFFAALHDGMTPSEVTAVLQREFPADRPYPVPVLAISDAERMLFFLEPTPFDDKGILVILRNGKVVAKQYTSD